MILGEIKTKMEGKFYWELIDERGKVKRWGDGGNIILNQGIYIAAQKMGARLAVIDGSYFYGHEGILGYVAVGTGSSTPTVTQTALDNEVARTGTSLGLGPAKTVTEVSQGVYEMTVVRAFDYGEANANLTELGGAWTSNTADATAITTRALFLDQTNNPTVVTKTSSYRLAITYTIRLTATPVVPTAGPVVTWYDSDGTTVQFTRNTDICFLQGLWNGLSGGLYDVYDTTPRLGVVTADWTQGYTTKPSSFSRNTATLNTYTWGDTFRDATIEIGPTSSDETYYGLYWHYYGSNTWDTKEYPGFTVRFTDGAGGANPIVKNKDYRIGFGVRISWAN